MVGCGGDAEALEGGAGAEASEVVEHHASHQGVAPCQSWDFRV